MISFEFECWKCGEWHTQAIETAEGFLEFMQVSGAAARIIDTEHVLKCYECEAEILGDNFYYSTEDIHEICPKCYGE